VIVALSIIPIGRLLEVSFDMVYGLTCRPDQRCPPTRDPNPRACRKVLRVFLAHVSTASKDWLRLSG
jgi:hypothetical protein